MSSVCRFNGEVLGCVMLLFIQPCLLEKFTLLSLKRIAEKNYTSTASLENSPKLQIIGMFDIICLIQI